ncbi:Uncharacterised protein [Yersinia intermedia]|nr:Uncharacterised protein [Yersinia intermedia]CNH42413.1 Uncharacterised protein [Yersinia intermedia]
MNIEVSIIAPSALYVKQLEVQNEQPKNRFVFCAMTLPPVTLLLKCAPGAVISLAVVTKAALLGFPRCVRASGGNFYVRLN